MRIRGIEISNCVTASGATNFFPEIAWVYDRIYEKIFPGFGIIYETTHVTKTTTMASNPGNMLLKENLQPKELKPACIKIYPGSSEILNKVNLSGPGADNLFERGLWQLHRKPFLLSFMAIKETRAERLQEARDFVDLWKRHLPFFESKVIAQINISCPNTGHDPKELANEAVDLLRIFSELGIPIDLKVNALVSMEVVHLVQASGLCDVLTVGNTMPYGTPGVGIDWEKKFGKKHPFAKFGGGGGYSGKELINITPPAITKMRLNGITMPIKGGGGILYPDQVKIYKDAGADAGVEIGSVIILKPWNVRKIIEMAEKVF